MFYRSVDFGEDAAWNYAGLAHIDSKQLSTWVFHFAYIYVVLTGPLKGRSLFGIINQGLGPAQSPLQVRPPQHHM
jgi:hypothetical protein